jgi:cellobiose-specific phosphotransferase system component IIC
MGRKRGQHILATGDHRAVLSHILFVLKGLLLLYLPNVKFVDETERKKKNRM